MGRVVFECGKCSNCCWIKGWYFFLRKMLWFIWCRWFLIWIWLLLCRCWGIIMCKRCERWRSVRSMIVKLYVLLSNEVWVFFNFCIYIFFLMIFVLRYVLGNWWFFVLVFRFFGEVVLCFEFFFDKVLLKFRIMGFGLFFGWFCFWLKKFYFKKGFICWLKMFNCGEDCM